MTKWMLYGANGYTGRLIAELAAERGIQPILAGRNRAAIEEMGQRYSMETRVFDLDEMGEHLQDVGAVLLAAGPFVQTSKQTVDACIAKGIHYLDITGELDIFEALHERDAEAREAGSVLIPGVGFDVVPSDCLAASLSAKMPAATHLELAFAGGTPSKGTTKTMLAHVGDGGAIRKDGRIERVPLGWRTKSVPFYDKERLCVTIPWGDVSTAFYSTGIENICVYTGANKSRVRQMKAVRFAAPILGLGLVQKQLGKLIDAKVQGPTAEQRSAMKTQLWAKVRDASGATLEATLTTPEGYSLTAMCALEAAERVGSVTPGFQTPSLAFGSGFISEFDSCTMRLPS